MNVTERPQPVLLGTPGSAEHLSQVSGLTRFGVGAMGVLALVATLLIHLTGRADDLTDYRPMGVVALALAALVVAVAAARRPNLLSPRTLPYLIPVGAVAVGVVSYCASVEFSPYASMFLCWSGTSIAFLRRRTALVLVAWAALVEAVLVVAQRGNAVPLARWQAIVLLTLTFTAGLNRLAARARDLVASEGAAREEAEAARAALEVVSADRSKFLASMSHQLRTPLNAIIGFSQVLVQRHVGELNPKQTEYTTDIVDSGRHLLSLVDDLLDLAKVEAGVLDLDVRRVDLAHLVRTSAALFKEQAGRRNVTLDIDVDPKLGIVEADERKIRQVLFNLLSNAVKFTPGGGRIVLRAQAQGDGVDLVVSDTGPGVAPHEQAAIFEEFHQAGATGIVSGTGLGLPLARRLIERHGGALTLESDGRTGSTFTARLPRRPQVEPTVGVAASVATDDKPRLLLGEPDSPERRFETGRSMFVVGSGIVMTAGLSLLLLHIHQVPELTETARLSWFAVIVAVGIVLCGAVWHYPREMGAPDVLPMYLPILAVSFGVAAYSLGASFAPYSFLASGAMCIAGPLISPRVGWLAVALASAMYATVFAVQPGNAAPAARWVLVSGFAAVTALLYSRFIGRITILAEAERDARAEAEQIGEALAVASRHKTEFLANMSHELRTPLNAIIGFSEVLAAEAFGPLNAKQREYIDDVHSSGRSLLDLINRILDLAKAEAGRMELQRNRTDVLMLCRDELARFDHDVESRELRLDVTLDDVGDIDADEAKVRQVLGSLVSNAVRYTPPGGSVAVRSARRNGHVEIEVADTGPGIAPAEHASIFEPFRGDSGLGLALSRHYAELHGGTLTVASEPGAGARFVLRLPA